VHGRKRCRPCTRRPRPSALRMRQALPGAPRGGARRELARLCLFLSPRIPAIVAPSSKRIEARSAAVMMMPMRREGKTPHGLTQEARATYLKRCVNQRQSALTLR